jgi:prolipoprotein diacylglyceryltransferase
MVRIGNFFNSEIVGRPTDVAWCVKFPRSANDYHLPLAEVPCRHPSQLYETAMGIGVLLILLAVDRKYKENRANGILGSLFMITYFIGRFLVEFVKEYQGIDPNTHALTEGQYLSIPFILIGFGMLAYTFKLNQKPIPPDLAKDAKKSKSKKKKQP